MSIAYCISKALITVESVALGQKWYCHLQAWVSFRFFMFPSLVCALQYFVFLVLFILHLHCWSDVVAMMV